MFDDETPVAWNAVAPHAVVVADDGTELGTSESMVGDENADIFHSVVVRRSSDGEAIEILAARVTRMTEHHVITDVGVDEANQQQAYRPS